MRKIGSDSFRFLFDQGGLQEVFDHARNVVVATIFVVAGLQASRHGEDLNVFVLLHPVIAGYFVAAFGCGLIILNFIDGFRKLAKLQWNIVLQAALSLAYFMASIRIIQLIVFWRTHTY